jgi:UDP-N-acetylmuramate--alanine ligase
VTRTAAEIGQGLAPARPARPIVPGERIHVVGMAGAGASAAGLLAHHGGALVTGCDPGAPSPYTPALDEAGLTVEPHHDPGHVSTAPPPDRLGVTKALTAVDPDHPELAAARAAGIPIEPWQQIVADALAGRRLVAVAGTHGKSTTAGWLVSVLAAAGRDPAAFVGALMPGRVTGGSPATARWGRGATAVVEADEYAGNFDPYRPDLVVLTSIEWDHPDVFADEAAVLAAFEAWLRRGRTDGSPPVLVANVSDRGVRALLERLRDWPGERVLSQLVDPAGGPEPARAGVAGRLLGADPGATHLEIAGLDQAGGTRTVALPTAGRHNVANALGVAAAARTLGLSADEVVAGLEAFEGVGRRLERRGEGRGVVVYDDYGHHPTAIRATIEAVRQREPGRRLWAVYEPLTFHRTAALLGAFADALATADAVAVAAIWAGRDRDTTSVSSADLAAAVRAVRPGIAAMAPGSVEETADWLAGEVQAGDAVLVMGGGRSYVIAERLVAHLAGP